MKRFWTGRAVLLKVSAMTSGHVEVPPHVDGQEVVSGSGESVSLQLGSMRDELKVAQRRDPRLAEIIAFLEKKPAGEFLAAPRRDMRRTKVRADEFKLAEDGVLLGKVEELGNVTLPVLPDVKYEGETKMDNAPPRMTWKHLVLAAVHNASAHRGVTEIVNELEKCCIWSPPHRLRADCEKWWAMCKHCVAVHNKPRAQAIAKAVTEDRPFYRVQIDFVEISPEGVNGEGYTLTFVCVATRYPRFRNTRTRDKEETGLGCCWTSSET